MPVPEPPWPAGLSPLKVREARREGGRVGETAGARGGGAPRRGPPWLSPAAG